MVRPRRDCSFLASILSVFTQFYTSTIFCKSYLVRLLVPLLLSHSRALQSPLDSKLQTDHSSTRHLFFRTLFLKNSVKLSFIRLNLTNCIPLRLPFLLCPHLKFILSSKLISSKNHFTLSLFHSPMSSSRSLTWLMYFISLSFHLYQPLTSHFICFTAYVSTQCLGISLHQFPFG